MSYFATHMMNYYYLQTRAGYLVQEYLKYLNMEEHKGIPLINLVQLDQNEIITSILTRDPGVE